MQKKYNIKNYNFILVAIAIAQAIYGIIIIGSAKESVQANQIQGLIMGIIVMVIVSLVSYSFVLRFYWFYYGACVLLLLAVKLFGRSVNNAKRWLVIAGVQFQPSEMAKILLILFFAQFIMKNRDRLNKLSVILVSLILLAIPWYLIQDEPDLSTSIVIMAIYIAMIYVGGLSSRIIFGVLSVAVPAFIITLFLILQPDQEIIKPYQQNRILAWLQPDKYTNTEGYQQQNSITAIGSGQLTGKGYKNNEVGSVKNGNFIAEPQTDFIIAVAGEELGFAGCVAIVLIFTVMVVVIVHVGIRASDLAGTLICTGVAAHIGIQSFINIGVATGLLPNTGLPLPFISYGSTSLVVVFAEIGLVLNVGLCRITEKRMQGLELDF